MSDLVLVTGGSGFVAAHVIVQLVAAGYRVRTTVRSAGRAAVVRDMLRHGGVAEPGVVECVEADLLVDAGWVDACAGCRYVLHVASPMAASQSAADLERAAVDGTLRVLRAARDAGVERVVYTSTCGAVYYGHPERAEPFDERDWTNLDSGEMSAYVRSKALAERAAWDFVAREGGPLELSVVNPSGIFGPALGRDYSSSLDLIRRLVAGQMPACPDLWFGVVDVRDVASLHLLAMASPQAAGERFICTQGGAVSMLAIARELKRRLGERGRRVPTRRLPNVVVRAIGLVNPEMKSLIPLLGKARSATSAKAMRTFGWQPRGWKDAVVASAESLFELGLVGAR